MKSIIIVSLLLFNVCFVDAQVVNPKPFLTMKGSKSPVLYIAISPKKDVMAVGFDEYAELFDMRKGKKILTLKHEAPDGKKTVNYVAFNENGEYVVTIDYKGKRKVWSVASGEEDRSLKKHTKWIPSPDMVKNELGLKMDNTDFDRYFVQLEAEHPKNKEIKAMSTEKGSVEFHNLADGAIEQELTFPDTKDHVHRYPVFFNDDGDIFVTGSDRGEVYLYKVAPKQKF